MKPLILHVKSKKEADEILETEGIKWDHAEERVNGSWYYFESFYNGATKMRAIKAVLSSKGQLLFPK